MGFRAVNQEKWSIELAEQKFQCIVNPELWLHHEWPAIPLFDKSDRIVVEKKCDLPFCGKIFPL